MWHAWERREMTAFLCENVTESDRLEDLGLEGSIILTVY